jgi:hypothetical protein
MSIAKSSLPFAAQQHGKILTTQLIVECWGILPRCAGAKRADVLAGMKSKELWFGKLAFGLVAAGLLQGGILVTRAQAQVDLSVNLNIQSPGDFNSPLAPYGSWVNVDSYGRCWRPGNLPPDWRPYTLGHWEWTDAGWYWASDEPWGWACFHYGQWVLDPSNGWVWLPGTQWAPAWVVWRQAPDYIGWAPCGPGGTAFSDNSFIFVDVHHFHDRLRPRELVFNDAGILHRSRMVGGFRTETRDWDGRSRRIAINRGPGVEPIQKATGARFAERPVRELVQQSRAAEPARRAPADRAVTQSPRGNERAVQPPTGRESQRLYREAPATQPPATGRQEERIYREAPTPQPAPKEVSRPQPTPREVPRQPVQPPRQAVPEVKTPTPVPHEQPLPPTGRESGRPEAQVPRRPEPAPKAVEHAPHVAPTAPPQKPVAPAAKPEPARDGHDRKRDGQ